MAQPVSEVVGVQPEGEHKFASQTVSPSMDALTTRQSSAVAFLREGQERDGVTPSITELCDHLGYSSKASAAKLLDKLEAKGAISRQPGARRAIRVLAPTGPRLNQLPLMGRIAAGRPLTSGEHIAEHIDVSPLLFNPPANLLFRVDGESMINAGIRPGDLIGVHLQEAFRNRQVVAALIIDPKTDDPELTLKTYRRQGNVITLLSENDDQERYPPMRFVVGKDQIQIIGLYCGLVRTQPQ